ncbi:MAG: cephalosporin hydroxylase family protein [Iphinoe sp. HA4291-MV1]|jgi:cephalosporin hydroxylase|nr:cephalosporin hydroxylase family protein [Iphinoe sp. HA4291-MV1]
MYSNNFSKQIPINKEVANLTEVINHFSKAYYDTPIINGEPTWKNTYWLGIKALKCPLDLWLYQEIISSQKPDFIVECGVAFGGTTAFLADVCNLVGKGEVIGIDINILEQTRHDLSRYENIKLIQGSSVSLEIAQQIFQIVEKKNTLVILDSDHSKNHVLQEILIYSKLIPSSGYLIVEDTNLNGHPVLPEFGSGPMEAVEEFLEKNSNFYIDKECHKFLTTFNPNGYLKRL